jgi:hypothetical protein
MSKRAIVLILMALALVTMACGIGGLSFTNVRTGPTVSKEISVNAPEEGTATLEINMGAGELSIQTGETSKLVEGVIEYNVDEIEPYVEEVGNRVTLEQGDLEGKRIPIGDWDNVVNRWDLTLGTAPMELTVNAGAAEAVLSGLADLNASRMSFNGGAGDFTLDYAGSLDSDMRVEINVGASDLTIVVPEGTAAEVSFRGALTDIDALGDWERAGGGYRLAGSGPVLRFDIRMGVGHLELRN